MLRNSNQYDLFEGMTSISAILNAGKRKIVKILVDSSKKKSKEKEIAFLKAKASAYHFPLEFVGVEEIEALANGNTHGGILAFAEPMEVSRLQASDIAENGFYVYLEGVEDPYNFGYTVRSLYAAGVTGVILPQRNWMSAAGIVARASAGTSELIGMFSANAEEVATLFRHAGYKILCAEIRDSVSIFEETFRLPILFVIGGEKRGISRGLLEKADQIVRIDYGREFRGSLSTAAAAAVLAFEIFRQNR